MPMRLLGAVLQLDVQVAVMHDRQFVLADLVAFRQVGIEVVLAREHRARRHARVRGQPEFRGHAHHLGIQHRQHAGQPEVDRAGLRIRLRAIAGGGAGEDLALCGELGVYFQPDDGFPFHKWRPLPYLPPPPGEGWGEGSALQGHRSAHQ